MVLLMLFWASGGLESGLRAVPEPLRTFVSGPGTICFVVVGIETCKQFVDLLFLFVTLCFVVNSVG